MIKYRAAAHAAPEHKRAGALTAPSGSDVRTAVLAVAGRVSRIGVVDLLVRRAATFTASATTLALDADQVAQTLADVRGIQTSVLVLALAAICRRRRRRRRRRRKRADNQWT